MKVTARDTSGNVLSSTRIVLPVSDEMDCRTCHASGSPIDARPAAGWVFDPDPERDYRLNVLRLHDEAAASSPAYAPALAAAGYDPAGLYANVTVRGKPVLCAACHSSEALPGSGQPGIPPLTRAVHSRHAGVNDPTNGQTLGSSANRSACYRCHPGSETKCLRGAMGAATAADGTMLMQCQELPRRDGGRGRGDAHRLVRRADLPAVPHGDGDEELRSDPLHVGLRRRPGIPASPPTRASRRTSTRPPRASRSTGSRRGTAASSARPATGRRTRSTPPPT